MDFTTILKEAVKPVFDSAINLLDTQKPALEDRVKALETSGIDAVAQLVKTQLTQSPLLKLMEPEISAAVDSELPAVLDRLGGINEVLFGLIESEARAVEKRLVG